MATGAYEHLVSKVAAALAPFSPRREIENAYSVFRLPAPPGAEYAFSVWIYDTGEPQIMARLVNADEHHSFWYKPFELVDWPSEEAREEAFLKTLGLVLNLPTRIVQRKGLLFWSFDCALQTEGGWKSISGIGILRRSNMEVPPIEERTRSYYSPPLLQSKPASG
jgi:hypothetical protein